MLKVFAVSRRRTRDEGEKPFWISFADLMTALMVLFLVVMSVELLRITIPLGAKEERQKQLDQNIQAILDKFETSATKFPGIRIDRDRRVIDFGERARFAFNSSTLNPGQMTVLREFVPEMLAISNDPIGVAILKRIVVEGFTDRTGTYLSNLNLSLQRSQRVLCAMFEAPQGTERPLTPVELAQVRSLFVVGGYSFNSARPTDEESRRVEMRLEFLGVDETREPISVSSEARVGVCGIR